MQNTISQARMLHKMQGNIHTTRNQSQKIGLRNSSDVKNAHYYEMDISLADQDIQVVSSIQEQKDAIKNSEWLMNFSKNKEGAIKRIIDLVGEARKTAALVANEQGPIRPGIKESLEGVLMHLQGELKSSNFSLNMWNGSRTNELPVDDVINNSNLNPTTQQPTASYYLGDDFKATAYLEGEKYIYGDTADQEAFNKFIGGVHLLIEGLKDLPHDKTRVYDADNMLQGVQDGFLSMLSKLGNFEKFLISNIEKNEQKNVDSMEMYTSLNGMSDTDRALLMTDLASMEMKMKTQTKFLSAYLKQMNIFEDL